MYSALSPLHSESDLRSVSMKNVIFCFNFTSYLLSGMKFSKV